MTTNVPGWGNIAEELRRVTVQVLADDERASGSGVIAARGKVITNAHVATSARQQLRAVDGRLLQGTLSKRDRRRDLAVIDVPEMSDVPVATLREASSLKPGEIAVAVGHPLGFIGAVSTGVIRAVGPISGLGSQSWVQAAVRLAPGNSGGPLADVSGRVVGVNAMVMNGLGLAVPAEAVQRFLSAAAPFHLGVTVRPARLRDGTDGMLILEIEQGSAAETASLLPGDLITTLDDKSAKTLEAMEQALITAGSEKRRNVIVHFRRGGSDRERKAVAASPSSVREQAA